MISHCPFDLHFFLTSDNVHFLRNLLIIQFNTLRKSIFPFFGNTIQNYVLVFHTQRSLRESNSGQSCASIHPTQCTITLAPLFQILNVEICLLLSSLMDAFYILHISLLFNVKVRIFSPIKLVELVLFCKKITF